MAYSLRELNYLMGWEEYKIKKPIYKTRNPLQRKISAKGLIFNLIKIN